MVTLQRLYPPASARQIGFADLKRFALSRRLSGGCSTFELRDSRYGGRDRIRTCTPVEGLTVLSLLRRALRDGLRLRKHAAHQAVKAAADRPIILGLPFRMNWLPNLDSHQELTD